MNQIRVFLCFVLVASAASANPEGSSIVAGQATVEHSAALTHIRQSTDRAIIDWRSFGNSAGETVRFSQPTATSATLNRVTGAEASVINGAMQANGRVFLVNPNGIVFGRTATVNTGGLVASTLDTTNADFLRGRHVFTRVPGKPAAAVVNQGTITAGRVALVGGLVINEGVISAPGGKVALAAGDRVTLALDGSALATVEAVATPGDVVAGAGAISDLATQAVNNSHIVRAGSVRRVGGQVVLGGAEGVAIQQGTIDVSAPTAGQVRVVSAQATVVTPGAKILANGTRGGDVRLLSKGTTLFASTSRVEARGGGFVEVSGKSVIARGEVVTRGPDGPGGTYLIDPPTLTILDGAGTGTQDANLTADGQILAADASVPPDTIYEAAIENLAAGTNILIQADQTITLSDISGGVGDDLLLPDGASLTLQTVSPGGSIDFVNPSNEIRARGNGTITIDSRGTANLGILTTAGGAIAISAAANIFATRLDAGTGTVALSTTGADIGTLASPIQIAAAALSIQAPTANAYFDALSTLGLGAVNTATFTLTAAGDVTDANGALDNIVSGTTKLFAAGTVGANRDALEVRIANGALTVSAGAADADHVSAAFDGSVTPSNTVATRTTPPGKVLFNGQDVNAPPPSAPPPSAPPPAPPPPPTELAAPPPTLTGDQATQARAADPAVQANLEAKNSGFASSATGGDALITHQERTTTTDDGASTALELTEATEDDDRLPLMEGDATIPDGTSNTIQAGESRRGSTTPQFGDGSVRFVNSDLNSIPDGTSNTLPVSEASGGGNGTQPSIPDGSSNTIQVGEASGDRTPRTGGTEPSIPDGSSNTIQVGEASADRAPRTGGTQPSIPDGSSNTIQVGEASGDRTPRTGGTEPSIPDGSSNTISVGEASADRTPRAGGTQPSIPDGSSNTIQVGEAKDKGAGLTTSKKSEGTKGAVPQNVVAGKKSVVPEGGLVSFVRARKK